MWNVETDYLKSFPNDWNISEDWNKTIELNTTKSVEQVKKLNPFEDVIASFSSDENKIYITTLKRFEKSLLSKDLLQVKFILQDLKKAENDEEILALLGELKNIDKKYNKKEKIVKNKKNAIVTETVAKKVKLSKETNTIVEKITDINKFLKADLKESTIRLATQKEKVIKLLTEKHLTNIDFFKKISKWKGNLEKVFKGLKLTAEQQNQVNNALDWRNYKEKQTVAWNLQEQRKVTAKQRPENKVRTVRKAEEVKEAREEVDTTPLVPQQKIQEAKDKKKLNYDIIQKEKSIEGKINEINNLLKINVDIEILKEHYSLFISEMFDLFKLLKENNNEKRDVIIKKIYKTSILLLEKINKKIIDEVSLEAKKVSEVIEKQSKLQKVIEARIINREKQKEKVKKEIEKIEKKLIELKNVKQNTTKAVDNNDTNWTVNTNIKINTKNTKAIEIFDKKLNEIKDVLLDLENSDLEAKLDEITFSLQEQENKMEDLGYEIKAKLDGYMAGNEEQIETFKEWIKTIDDERELKRKVKKEKLDYIDFDADPVVAFIEKIRNMDKWFFEGTYSEKEFIELKDKLEENLDNNHYNFTQLVKLRNWLKEMEYDFWWSLNFWDSDNWNELLKIVDNKITLKEESDIWVTWKEINKLFNRIKEDFFITEVYNEKFHTQIFTHSFARNIDLDQYEKYKKQYKIYISQIKGKEWAYGYYKSFTEIDRIKTFLEETIPSKIEKK